MAVGELREFLGWCTVLNYLWLSVWWLMLLFAREWMYELHSKWFALDRTAFDLFHYRAIAWFKILVLVFNLTPYLALVIMSD